MQSVVKEYVLPLLRSPDDAEIRSGDTVRLHLTDSIPNLPSPILAVVQHPIDRILTINPATNCRVNGYRYTFLYDEAQLNGIVDSIDSCDITSVEGISCCEILDEKIEAETAARIAAIQAETAARIAAIQAETAARIASDANLEETIAGVVDLINATGRDVLTLSASSPYRKGTVLTLPELAATLTDQTTVLRLTQPPVTVDVPIRDCVVAIDGLTNPYVVGPAEVIRLAPLNADGINDPTWTPGTTLTANDRWSNGVLVLERRTSVVHFEKCQITFLSVADAGSIDVGSPVNWSFQFADYPTQPTVEAMAALFEDAVNSSLWLPFTAIRDGANVTLQAKNANTLVGTTFTTTLDFSDAEVPFNEFRYGFPAGLNCYALADVTQPGSPAIAYFSSNDITLPGTWKMVSSEWDSGFPLALTALTPSSYTFRPQVILERVGGNQFVVVRSCALTRQFLNSTWKVEKATDDIWKFTAGPSDPVLSAGLLLLLGQEVEVEFSGPDPRLPVLNLMDFTGEYLTEVNAIDIIPQIVPNATVRATFGSLRLPPCLFMPVPYDANNSLSTVNWAIGELTPWSNALQRSFTEFLLYLAGNSISNGELEVIRNEPTDPHELLFHPANQLALQELGQKGWLVSVPNFANF